MTFGPTYLSQLATDFKAYLSCLDLIVLDDLENRGYSDIIKLSKRGYATLRALQYGIDLEQTTTDDFATVVSELLNFKANYPFGCVNSLNPFYAEVTPLITPPIGPGNSAYIFNQYAGPQNANLWVNGNGRFDGELVASNAPVHPTDVLRLEDINFNNGIGPTGSSLYGIGGNPIVEDTTLNINGHNFYFTQGLQFSADFSSYFDSNDRALIDAGYYRNNQNYKRWLTGTKVAAYNLYSNSISNIPDFYIAANAISSGSNTVNPSTSSIFSGTGTQYTAWAASIANFVPVNGNYLRIQAGLELIPASSGMNTYPLFSKPIGAIANSGGDYFGFTISADQNSNPNFVYRYAFYANSIPSASRQVWYELPPTDKDIDTIITTSLYQYKLHIDVARDSSNQNFEFRSRVELIVNSGNTPHLQNINIEFKDAVGLSFFNSRAIPSNYWKILNTSTDPNTLISNWLGLETSTPATISNVTSGVGPLMPYSFKTRGNTAIFNNTTTTDIADFQINGVKSSSFDSSGNLVINALSTTTSSITLSSTNGAYRTVLNNNVDATNAFEIKNGGQTLFKSTSMGYTGITIGNASSSKLNIFGSVALAGNGFSSSGLGSSVGSGSTITATANSDVLIGIDINSVFSPGSPILTYDTLVGGSGYTNGTWTGIALVLISGSKVVNAIGTVVVSGGSVTGLTITYGGAINSIGDILTAASGIGPGTGFSFRVASVGAYTGLSEYQLRVQNGTSLFAPSVAGYGSIIIPQGVAYTGTTSGSVWQDGTHLYAYIGGGIRQLDQQAGVGFTNPMNAAGDIIVGGTSGAATKLAKGTANQFPAMNNAGTTLEYKTLSLSGGLQGGFGTPGFWSLFIQETIVSQGDANISAISAGTFYEMGTVLTANRSVTMGPASSYTGQKITLWNRNTNGFTWTFVGATVLDTTGSSLAGIANNQLMVLESDGTNWVNTSGVGAGSTWTGAVIAGQYGGTGVANTGKTITIGGNLSTSGAFTTTLTVTANTSVTLPTSGTLYGTATGSITSAQLAASLTDETGSGASVFANSPTLVTPVLGVAAATSINKVTITQPTTGSTLTIADGASLVTSGAFSVTLTSTGATAVTLPTSGTLYGTATGSISSAQMLASLSDETGIGALVFANAPTLVNPIVGTQTAGDNSTKAASTAYVDGEFSSTTQFFVAGTFIGSVNPTTPTPGSSGNPFTLGIYTSANVFSALNTVNQASLGTGNGDAFIVGTGTASVSSGATVQNSGSIVIRGTAWGATLASSQNVDFYFYGGPTSAATPSGNMYLYSRINGGTPQIIQQWSTAGGTIYFNTVNQNLNFIGSTSTDGFTMNNSAAASSGTTLQRGARFRFGGSVWNTTPTAAANYFQYTIEPTAVSGTVPTSTLDFWGYLGTSTTATFVKLMSLGSGGDLTLQTGGFIMAAAGQKFTITEGSNSKVGQTVLVAGTKAITITGLTTSSRAFVSLVAPGGASLTVEYQCVCTSNTLTIQANLAATTINASDTSTINYFVIN